jgi:hypothetical protein
MMCCEPGACASGVFGAILFGRGENLLRRKRSNSRWLIQVGNNHL